MIRRRVKRILFKLLLSCYNSGAVAEDGTIQPGDMILQVNEASFENLTNDEAVKILREAVHQPV